MRTDASHAARRSRLKTPARRAPSARPAPPARPAPSTRGRLAGLWLAASAVSAAMWLAAGAWPAQSVAATPSGYSVQRVCGTPLPGRAACMGLKLVQEASGAVAPDVARAPGEALVRKSPLAGFITPEDLHAAYSLPDATAAGATQTIAVVDAFDDPDIEADLGVYDEEFDLPACTSANGCFRKVNEEGAAAPLPRKNGGWASEISIDVEMAHAICEDCHVLLVEARNETLRNLASAVETAVAAGAEEVSDSYGAAERAAYVRLAGAYDHPGVVITASSGDCGYLNEACAGEREGAEYPADSPDVVAVGGTSLTETGGAWTSRVWNEGGSGCSVLFAAPSWQSAAPGFAATGCGAHRAIADVSAVADPDTGVDVYDSVPEYRGEQTGWTVFGG